MRNNINFLAIAILIGSSFLAATAQESNLAVTKEVSIAKVGTKLDSSSKRSSSDDASWTGFYVGGFGGYTNGRANPRTSTTSISSFLRLLEPDVKGVNQIGNQRLVSNSVSGGATFGYNRQKGRIIVGGEVDLGYQPINKSTSVTSTTCCEVDITVAQSVKSKWMMTARPRVGVAVKKTLVYVTAGVAVSNLKYDGSFGWKIAPANTPGARESGEFSKTKAAGVIGGGAEFKVSKHWSVKGEYLFSQFKRTAIKSSNLSVQLFELTPFPDQVFTHSTDLKSHSIRFGVNYRF